MDIAEFLTARYDEDEAAACAATGARASGGSWEAFRLPIDMRHRGTVADAHGDIVIYECYAGPNHANHIARNDPARVLADLAAKRRILKRHSRGHEDWRSRWHPDSCVGCGTTGEFDDPRIRHINDCPELRDLASVYAEHPHFDPAWTVDAAE